MTLQASPQAPKRVLSNLQAVAEVEQADRAGESVRESPKAQLLAQPEDVEALHPVHPPAAPVEDQED
jgi:hypothetical protein